MKIHVRVGQGLLVLALVVGMLVSAFGAAPASANPAPPTAPLANALRISQVYGGGGGSGYYLYDYAEVFNSGLSPVTLTGWSLQYGSATGNFAASTSNLYAFPAGTTIPAGKYLLVQLGAAGTSGLSLPATPDLTTTNLAMSQSNGKIALANIATTLGCGATATPCSLPDSRIVDLAAWGTSNNAEGGVSINNGAALTNQQGGVRKGGGCQDTDNNNADFDVLAGALLVPRNSSSSANVCSSGDAAPFVSSTTPTTGAPSVPPNVSVNVTFSEPVTFSGPISIICTSGTQSGIMPSGGTTTWNLAHTDFAPGDSCSITIPAGQVSDVDTNDPPDNMAADYTWSFTVAAACGGPATLIHAIQGNGASSPLTGSTVTVEGLVAGDFQASAQLKGFFVQEETADFDGDPATSEGIFVFEGASSLLDVAVGDKVRLSGTISEYGDRTVGTGTLTEVSSLSLLQTCTSGNAVTPVPVTLPETVNGDLERYEGMLVSIASPMTISQNYFVGRYGQMTLSSNGRMYQSTNVFDPGSPAQIALADENTRRTLILDDGKAGVRCGDNPNPVPYLGGPPPAVIRAGDTVSNLIGVLDYGQINSGSTGSCSNGATLFAGDFRLHPTQAPVFTPTNPRPATPPAVGGTLRVASANLLNYFNTFGAGACTLGAGGAATDCRGADTQAEFDRQAAKLVLAIVNNGADVIGFMEMENDGYGANSAVQDLVTRLNTATAPGTYAFVNPDATLGTNSLGIDAIKVGVIYKPARVTPVGTAVLNSAAFTDPANSGTQKSRPALSQTFEDTTWGERFTVVVNHLKSKGSNCSPSSIPNDDDPVQGNCNGTRTAGAAVEVAWLSSTVIPSTGDTDLLVMGDMNAYAKEDPIDQFVNGGYTNILEQYAGSSAYSYIFDGLSGNLDHALVSSGLASRVVGAGEWHINADEPTVIDYNQDFNPPGYYTADQYRSSDHDPLGIGLALNPDQSDLAGSYGLAWHTDGGKLRLGALWTGEASNTPDGDTGDDGVTIDTSNWRRGGTTAATAVVTRLSGSGNAWLAGWADWNNNGSFADPGERIVNGSVIVGSNIFSSIPIPVDAVVGVPVNMRFRLYDSLTEPAALAPLAASPSGRGNGGEVEDQSIRSIPLAVLLAGFDATAQGDAVLVTWDTVSELNNQGFNLYRGGSPTAPETLLGYLPSQAPGSGAGASYQWLDEGLAAGQTFYYWLEAVDLSGATTLHGPVSATTQSPTAVTLSGLEADSRPGISAGWIGAVLFLVIGLASVVLTAERRQRRVR